MSIDPLSVWALTVVALFLKMFAVALVQGHHRLKSGVFVRPEDAAHWAKAPPAAAELPIVRRAQSTLGNDLENIPMFAIIAFAYVELGAWELGTAVYCGLFVVSRVVHTAAYLSPRQPLRNRAYILGAACTLAMCGHILVHVLS